MEKAGLVRKATVEIQRRPARQGTVTLKPNSSMQKTRSFADPRSIPQLLKQVYAPEEYDESSSVLICNFPCGFPAANCRNFCGWFGPVVRVERTSSVAAETNFVVVFADPHPAQVLSQSGEVLFLDGKTHLFCRAVDPRPSLWRSVASLWSGA